MNPFIYDVVSEAVKRQPWYAKNANTIVAGLTLLASLLSFVLVLELDLPPVAAASIPVVVQAIGTFVTKLMPNGVQMSMVDKLAATTASRSTPGMSLIAAEIERARGHATQVVEGFGAMLESKVDPWPESGEPTGRHRAE